MGAAEAPRSSLGTQPEQPELLVGDGLPAGERLELDAVRSRPWATSLALVNRSGASFARRIDAATASPAGHSRLPSPTWPSDCATLVSSRSIF